MNDWHLIGHCFHSLHATLKGLKIKGVYFKEHYVNLDVHYHNFIEKLLLKGGKVACYCYTQVLLLNLYV